MNFIWENAKFFLSLSLFVFRLYDAPLMENPPLIDFGSIKKEMKDIYKAVRKGVDFNIMWYDMKKNPAPYHSTAFSTALMGTFSGYKRGGYFGE